MKKPNIVLIILDSARSDMFGCYGHPGNLTPNLDTLAKESLLCRNNYSAGNGSAMGHTGIFSGQHAARHRMVHNLTEMPIDLIALPAVLRDLGYRTRGHIQVSFIPPAGHEKLFGFDELIYPGQSETFHSRLSKKNLIEIVRGFPWLWSIAKRTYENILGDRWKIKTSASLFDGLHSIQYLLNQLSSSPDNRPVFAYSTLMHPHTPYYPPQWCIKKVFGKQKIDKMAYRIQLDFHGWFNGNYGDVPQGIDSLKKLYQAELHYADYLVGLLVAGLKERSLYENTILIVAADHGEYLGEHGLLNHGDGVWEEIYRTPLILSYPPDICSGQIIDQITSNLDIFPTILKILGVEKELELDGIPLTDSFALNKDRSLVIDSPPIVLPGRLRAYPKIMAMARTIYRAIVTNRFKYIWSSDGGQSLFSFGAAESEENNLIDQYPAVAQEYHEKMIRFYQEIEPDYQLNHYPLKLSPSGGQRFGNPLIVQELKKLGYL